MDQNQNATFPPFPRSVLRPPRRPPSSLARWMCLATWSRPGEYGLNVRKGNTVVVCLHSSASACSADSKWKKHKGSDILSRTSAFLFLLLLHRRNAPLRVAQARGGRRQIKAGMIVEVGEKVILAFKLTVLPPLLKSFPLQNKLQRLAAAPLINVIERQHGVNEQICASASARRSLISTGSVMHTRACN